jgi:hypothetical protein
MFQGNIMDYTYKLVEVSDYLVPSLMPNPSDYTVHWTEGCHAVDLTLERRKVWKVEATSKDSSYCYGKRLWYLGPDNWFIQISENYDRQGQVWKEHYMIYTLMANAYGAGPCSIGQGPP